MNGKPTISIISLIQSTYSIITIGSNSFYAASNIIPKKYFEPLINYY